MTAEGGGGGLEPHLRRRKAGGGKKDLGGPAAGPPLRPAAGGRRRRRAGGLGSSRSSPPHTTSSSSLLPGCLPAHPSWRRRGRSLPPRTVTAHPRPGPGLETHPWRWPAAGLWLPLLPLGLALPQPRRHRAGRPLLAERLPPAAAAAILRRPLRRIRRGAAALPRSAYARPLWRQHGLSGSARLRSRLLLLLLLPRRLRPAPHTLARCPPPRARSGGSFRLGAARSPPRSPRLCRRPSQPGCSFLPLLVTENRDRAAAILKPGTFRAAAGLCPEQRWPPALRG